MDSLIDQARATLDRDKQAELFSQLQQQVNQDVPSVPLVYSDLIQGVSEQVQNYTIYPGGDLEELERVWFSQE